MGSGNNRTSISGRLSGKRRKKGETREKRGTGPENGVGPVGRMLKFLKAILKSRWYYARQHGKVNVAKETQKRNKENEIRARPSQRHQTEREKKTRPRREATTKRIRGKQLEPRSLSKEVGNRTSVKISVGARNGRALGMGGVGAKKRRSIPGRLGVRGLGGSWVAKGGKARADHYDRGGSVNGRSRKKKGGEKERD